MIRYAWHKCCFSPWNFWNYTSAAMLFGHAIPRIPSSGIRALVIILNCFKRVLEELWIWFMWCAFDLCCSCLFRIACRQIRLNLVHVNCTYHDELWSIEFIVDHRLKDRWRFFDDHDLKGWSKVEFWAYFGWVIRHPPCLCCPKFCVPIVGGFGFW